MSTVVLEPQHQGKTIVEGIPPKEMHAALFEAILKTKLYPDSKKDETTVERVLEDVTEQLKPLPNPDKSRTAWRKAYKEERDVKEHLTDLKAAIEGVIVAYATLRHQELRDKGDKKTSVALFCERLGLDDMDEKNEFGRALDKKLTAAVKALEQKYPTSKVSEVS